MSAIPILEVLDWDSRFFGFGVGRLGVVPVSTPQLADIRQLASEAGFRLLYVACDPADGAARASLAEAGAFLADMKRTYVATMACTPLGSANIEPVGELMTNPSTCEMRQLRMLAWQAAEQSRFKIDPRMPASAWRRMYSTWIANSLNGTIADRVLATRTGDTLSGMVTIALRGDRASIGLLAVHQRHRGHGLGRRLVQAAFEAAYDSGLSELSVVTQGDNSAACRTYESCGMVLTNEQCIFHLWTNL